MEGFLSRVQGVDFVKTLYARVKLIGVDVAAWGEYLEDGLVPGVIRVILWVT